jgi:acyl-CoA reductase-like NAD-dependent aldehyde dehydrogenase
MTAIVGIDPRTGEPVGDGVPETTPEHLDQLLTAAAQAAEAFAGSEPAVRAGLLRALADALDAQAAPLAELAGRETGLPAARLIGEVARTSFQLRLFAEVVDDGGYLEATLDSADPGAAPAPRPDLRRMLEPLGPVLVFAASNFPFAFSVLGGDTASALAAGCPVVVKAHGSHPALSAEVGRLAATVIADLGLPAGVFGLVFGVAIGGAAVQDPRITACGFTGSTTGGRALFDLAVGRPDPIPFYGELGSINPTVVTPDAVAARGAEIVAGYVGSFTLGGGQFCTKPGLLFLPRGHGLEARLAEAVAAVAATPMLDARIRDRFVTGTGELGERADVRTLTSDDAAASAKSEAKAGAWAAPRLFLTDTAAVLADPATLIEEHFGPSSLIVEYDDPAALLAALGSIEGSLTATLQAQDDDAFGLDAVLRVLRRRVGRVIYNGWPTGVAVAWAMQHGGPWPSTTSAGHTSVGATAIRRWVRPVCYQSLPHSLLPEALQDGNPWRLPRRLDGVLTLP